MQFCQSNIAANTDWHKVLFVDESSFYLDNNHRWVWRKCGEFNEALVRHQTTKYIPKVMMFGGISYEWRTPLISIQGTIDSDVYIDECIDDSGLIPSMNEIYGPRNWSLLHDGASCHTSFETNDYLKNYCNIIQSWPPNSPDLNPIENFWLLLKRSVEELEPQTIEELINVSFDTWENYEVDDIHNLIDSVPNRLAACINANGMQKRY